MATGELGGVIGFIRRVAGQPPAAGETDAELLERFVRGSDHAAYERLLRRHAGLVWGVCQRLLAHRQDAEDAFQATFLALLRGAASIGRRDALAGWLYGVAYRTALKARAAAARRRDCERQGEPMPSSDPVADVAWRDLRPVLDEELGRLPEKYRAPLVLCYLDGKTNEQAARELGWTKGTVSGRLARARDLLRGRLARRGLALPAGVFAAALSTGAAEASVPSALLDSTLTAAALVAAGKAAPAVVFSAATAALAEGMTKTMFLTPAKTMCALLLAVSLVGTGAGFLVRANPAARLGEAGAAADDEPARGGATDQERILGTWRPESAERGGQAATGKELEEAKKVALVFLKDKVVVVEAKRAQAGKYKLDTTRNPHAIEIQSADDAANAPFLRGVYSLKRDVLTLALSADRRGNPPTELTSRAGTDHVLMVLKRDPNVRAGELPKDVKDIRPLESPQRAIAANDLKQIALAMHNYHDVYGRLPPAALYGKDGKPLLSWRVLILPFLEQDNLYRQFKLNEPWDSPKNRPLLARMPEVYKAKGAAKAAADMTHFQVFVGLDTAFEGTKGIKLSEFHDGTSNTLLVVEAARPVPWTKPDDVPYSDARPLPALVGVFPDGFNAAFADGSVQFLRKDADEATLRLLIKRSDGQPIQWEKVHR